MKTLRRLILMLAACTLLAGIQLSPVSAGSTAQEISYNPDAETYIREELLKGNPVDLATRFTSDAERTIRAGFIVSLWQDPELQGISVFKLSNAMIVGDMEAQGNSIPFNVEFDQCTFTGNIHLDSAETRTFRIDRSTVIGAVRMGRMNVDGDLALYQSKFEGLVTLFDAYVSRNLFARDSEFRAAQGDQNSLYPFELWKIKVEQSTEFSNSVIKGEVKADNAEFGVDARFDGVTFEKPASFENIQVGVLADFQKAVFKSTVTFQSSLIDRDIVFSDATFEDSANFDYLSVERFLDFDYTTVHKDFSFLYPTIGWPYFEGTTFSGPVLVEGVHTENDFDFNNAVYEYPEEPFKVYLCKVDGQGLFNGFVSPAGLDLSHNVFGDLEISGIEQGTFENINLDSTVVNGDLILDNLVIGQLSAKELDVSEKATLTRLTVSQKLNLSNANLGFLTIDVRGFWPAPLGQSFNSNLQGMSYNDIGFVLVVEELESEANSEERKNSVNKEFRDAELGETNWRVLSKMVDESEFSSQAYRSLAQFLTEKGHPEWGTEVELNRRNRERGFLEPGSGAWFWSWFSYYFSGYGQKPELALIWSALVIAIGAVFYWRERDLLVIDQDEARLVYNPFLYSFALFAPFIELDIAEKWEPKPERRVAWIYKYVLKLLGWILTPIALLTFGGIIQ